MASYDIHRHSSKEYDLARQAFPGSLTALAHAVASYVLYAVYADNARREGFWTQGDKTFGPSEAYCGANRSEDRLLIALHCLTMYKSSYRAAELARHGITYSAEDPTIKECLFWGYVNVNKGGALVPDRAKIKDKLANEYKPAGAFIENESLSFKSRTAYQWVSDSRGGRS